jgi:pimeloyl-ACP methyl ester carboxylesterase
MVVIGSPTKFFKLSDGLTLCYAIYGDPNATKTVFFHHGIPGCQVEAVGFDEEARQRNIRLISIDRPGMGGSTHQPERTLLDWPGTLLALADHLKVDRFAVLGVSGGGPYTLACIYKIPRTRCIGGVIRAGMFPVSLGLDGMMFQNRLLFNILPWTTWPVEKGLDLILGSAARDSEHPERLEKLMDKDFRTKPELHPDRLAWEKDAHMRTILAEDIRQALQDGSRGAALDLYLMSVPWGFALEELTVDEGRLVLWHGALDGNIPVVMAKRAVALIRGAELRILDSEGHLSANASRFDEVMECLNTMLTA